MVPMQSTAKSASAKLQVRSATYKQLLAAAAAVDKVRGALKCGKRSANARPQRTQHRAEQEHQPTKAPSKRYNLSQAKQQKLPCSKCNQKHSLTLTLTLTDTHTRTRTFTLTHSLAHSLKKITHSPTHFFFHILDPTKMKHQNRATLPVRNRNSKGSMTSAAAALCVKTESQLSAPESPQERNPQLKCPQPERGQLSVDCTPQMPFHKPSSRLQSIIIVVGEVFEKHVCKPSLQSSQRVPVPAQLVPQNISSKLSDAPQASVVAPS